jgi:phosphate transport system permease protein
MAATSSSLSATDAVLKSLKGRRIDVRGLIFEGLLLFSLLFSLAVLITLLADVIRAAMPVFQERGSGFLKDGLTTFGAENAGVWHGIIGSMLTIIFVAIVAFPLGIAAAVYLEEYAKDTAFNRFISVNIRNLAGVPSIVYGLLGLAIFVEFLGPGGIFNLTGGGSVISGGLTLAILVLPIVIITASEALRAVPDSIREAGYGVGATQWEVIRSHVVPSAAPGILTGTVLSFSRALGETAPVLLVGAATGFLATGSQNFLEQLRGSYTTLPTAIYAYARQPSPDFRAVTAAAIVVLLLVILTANAAAIMLRNRYERKW